jgi:hypothetical protein
MEKKRLAMGFIIPNVFALICMTVTSLLRLRPSVYEILVASNFTALPFAMGMLSVYCWRKTEMGTLKQMEYAFYSFLIALALSALFMGEGYICLLIVSPLLFIFLFVGALIGRLIFKRRSSRLNVSVTAALMLLVMIDMFSAHEYRRVVSDEIHINAPPEKVWEHVVAFEPIQEEPRFWLFRIGLPRPVATTVEGYHEGAGRKCIFNNGVVFREKMVVYEPGRNLTFDIVEQPADPEIMGHIALERGQFLLKANSDGTTTLTGNSWYSLYVFPAWYYDLWAESITRNVHFRVMEHIKYLSEKK